MHAHFAITNDSKFFKFSNISINSLYLRIINSKIEKDNYKQIKSVCIATASSLLHNHFGYSFSIKTEIIYIYIYIILVRIIIVCGLRLLDKLFARENGYNIAKSVAPFLVAVCCLSQQIWSYAGTYQYNYIHNCYYYY